MLAYLLPGLSLMFNGRPFSGLFMLLIQISGIGWLIGIWMATNNLKERAAERRHRETLQAMTAGGAGRA